MVGDGYEVHVWKEKTIIWNLNMTPPLMTRTYNYGIMHGLREVRSRLFDEGWRIIGDWSARYGFQRAVIVPSVHPIDRLRSEEAEIPSQPRRSL